MSPTTQKRRINWATRHRKIFLFPDNDIYKPKIPVVESDADIEDIKLAQIRYEKRYRDERRRFGEEKVKRKEKRERALAELLEKYPDLASKMVVLQVREGNGVRKEPCFLMKMKQPRSTTRRPNPHLISKKRSRSDGDDKDKDEDENENENATRAPVPKRSRTMSRADHQTEYGDIYENPCGECAKNDQSCQLLCWECHHARTACPFQVATTRKKKTTPAESISFSALPSEDEDNRFANNQSSRITQSSLEDFTALVKAIKETANTLDQNFKFLTERVVLMSADIRTMADYARKKNGEPILGPIDRGGQRTGKPQSGAGEKRMKDRSNSSAQ